MEKAKKYADEIGLVHQDIQGVTRFLKIDRFKSGAQTLEKWLLLASLIYKAKQAWKRNVWVKHLSACLDYNLTENISKPDMAALGKLADYDAGEIRKWYKESGKFMVSPRNILKAFEKETGRKEDSPEKTELQKLLQTVETLTKQLENYELSELDARAAKSAIKDLTTIKPNVKSESNQKVS